MNCSFKRLKTYLGAVNIDLMQRALLQL